MKENKKFPKYVNLACGNNFVNNSDWLNLDFIEREGVKKTNLLDKLQLKDSSIEAIYCSHFVEHIPKKYLNFFFNECKRVLKVGGVMRIVVPDFEKMAKEYLDQRVKGNNLKANFMMTSIIDQFVRKEPGGELAEEISQLSAADNKELKQYVLDRVGNVFEDSNTSLGNFDRKLSTKLINIISKIYVKLILSLIPKTFYSQNVSMAEVGELHKWIYDKHLLTNILIDCGFMNVQEVNHDYSKINNFPLSLDTNKYGKPIKGLDSLFLEAIK